MKPIQQQHHNPPLLGLVTGLTGAYFLYYLWWRATATLNPEYPFMSWTLWLAEAFGVLSYLLFVWITRNVEPLSAPPLPARGLSVDIFVPTYNEDVTILEATLIGCRKIRYPHTTYVLDDGDRPEVRALAERLGCRYIARPVRDHAKAGNINHALQGTYGQFIVVLDADMIPQPEFLDRTLGYFNDEKLAIIQLPQEFYNWDSIQHASRHPTWHEQSLFFRVIQPGKNYSDSAFWCGSPAVLRRSALEDIGGVATSTITEDIHTTVLLHSRGWKTLYVNEPLAFGIAPQTIRAFLLQRLRWAQGTMQLYRSKESPLRIPGLSWRQRLSYFSSFLAYFEAFQKFILITVPILILGFHLEPMEVGVMPFLIHWLPYFSLNILANHLAGRGSFNYFKTEKYNILKTMIFIESSLTLFSSRPLKFAVTPKTVDSDVYQQERTALRWYMAIFGTLVGSMFFALGHAFILHSTAAARDMFWIALFWAGYNAYVIYMALREVLEKRHERRQYRFQIDAPGSIHGDPAFVSGIPVQMLDLSINGAGFLADQKFHIPADGRLNLKVYPDGFEGFALPIEQITYQNRLPSGKIQFGVSLADHFGTHRMRQFEYLFVHLPGAGSRKIVSSTPKPSVRPQWVLYKKILSLIGLF